MRLYHITISLLGVLALGAGPASAQNYPSRPIHVVTSDAGGGNDVVLRVIGQGLTAAMGQQVVVENKGGGVIAGTTVKAALADGYTLLFYGGTLWLLPLMRNNVPYDALRDFAPITLAVTTPTVLTVHPSLPVKSVKELIALAKSHPGQLNYGSPAVGTSTHLAAELLKSMAHVDIVRIGYRGGGAMLNDLIAGQLQLAFVVSTSVGPHVKSGRLRALAVSSAKRTPLFPELPAISEVGLSGYESISITGFFAPAKTPEAIVTRLNQEMVKVLHNDEVKARFLGIGAEAVGNTPEEFVAKIKSENAKWGKVIKEAAIRDE